MDRSKVYGFCPLYGQPTEFRIISNGELYKVQALRSPTWLGRLLGYKPHWFSYCEEPDGLVTWVGWSYKHGTQFDKSMANSILAICKLDFKRRMAEKIPYPD